MGLFLTLKEPFPLSLPLPAGQPPSRSPSYEAVEPESEGQGGDGWLQGSEPQRRMDRACQEERSHGGKKRYSGRHERGPDPDPGPPPLSHERMMRRRLPVWYVIWRPPRSN